MTLKNNRAPFLCYFKFCASFRTLWWIQPWVTVRKRPIWVKINDVLSSVTFKLDVWPWKKIAHFFYDTWNSVHHFNAIGKFKLKLKSANAQFGSKSMIFLDVWPRNFTDDPEKQWGTSSMLLQALCIISYPLVNSNWSYSPETPKSRSPLLCYHKLCASFCSHWWVQTGVTVRKRPIRVKFDDF